ncbi:DUF1707 domain-containing protein [Brevibacterium daeguense]|uniref:DUF1707 domain-containing protein n=1 Tax=Brevibacterium daeguense TaxID=909936 RepID=A0ABP8ELC9_9MICO|nr:DUF1707 domain-containing protein [Brevibacterium daeguense]
MSDSQGEIEPRRRRVRAADADRDAVLEVLAKAHANGRLDTGEVDERQTHALRAKFLSELPELIDDLPEGRELTHRINSQLFPHPYAGGGPGAIVPSDASGPSGEVIPARAGTGSTENSVAIMSGRDLVVQPGTPVVHLYALMGGDSIYLSEVLGPGVQVTLEAYSMWAGHDIYVPGGVRIIDKTFNVMAGNDIHKHARGDGSNGTLILTGFSLMAGHDIKLDPNWRADERRRGLQS